MQNEEKIQRQLELEQESIEIGIAKYRETLHKPHMHETDLPPGQTLLFRCVNPFAEAIRIFCLPTRNGGGGRLNHVKRFLTPLSHEEVAFIAAKRIINAISEIEPIQRVAISIANMIHDQMEYRKFQEENPGYLRAVESHLKTSTAVHKRRVILRAKRKLGIEDTTWTEIEKVQIGLKLIELFISSTGMVEKVFTKIDKKDVNILQPTESIKRWILESHAKAEVMNPLYMPMIVPPKDWSTPFDGGFLSNEATMTQTLIKTRDHKALLAISDREMPLVYNAINALQRTPWRINKQVYDVMKEIWESGGILGGLPSMEETPLPPKPWSTDEEHDVLAQTAPEVVKDWKMRATQIYDQRVRDISKRYATAQKLWIAEKFKDEPEIFFCWTLDWRGRMYPVQGFINPQIDDSGKSLIEFSEGKPLGERGVYWLKVHLANCYGVDKVTFDERVKWVDEHEAYILDSATNPLDGFRFWADTDEAPYQFLAACFEYARYKEQGADIISHLPIALDGTCNGLQNFSALLRDEIGGKATNLVPQDKPADIYAEVAKIVSKMVERDADAGDEQAHIWVGKVNRKITKRGVMTTPYGAKFYGLKDQLINELKKLDTPTAKYLESTDNYKPCQYLAEKLYDAIGQVVVAARQAMDWLQIVAKVCSQANIPIEWTTPSGFRPHQEYLIAETDIVKTIFGGVQLKVRLARDTIMINKSKQASGISPNYIHSLDASHLVLTINKCLENGIHNFSMIHDSYGTHACDIDKLAHLLRDAFIEQYSEDLLAKLRDEIMAQLPEKSKGKIPPLPKKGGLDLEVIRESRYFFA